MITNVLVASALRGLCRLSRTGYVGFFWAIGWVLSLLCLSNDWVFVCNNTCADT